MLLLLLLEEVLELQQLLLELLLVEHVWGAPSGASLRQNTGGRRRHRLRGWRLSAQQPLSRGAAAAAAAHSFTEPIPPCLLLLLPPGVIASSSLWRRFPNPTSPNPLPPSPASRARSPPRSPPRRGRTGPGAAAPSLPRPAGTHGAARGVHRSSPAASIFPPGTITTCPAPLPGRTQAGGSSFGRAGGPGRPPQGSGSPPEPPLRSPQLATPPFLIPRTEAGVRSPVPREGWEGMDTICPGLGRGNGING